MIFCLHIFVGFFFFFFFLSFLEMSSIYHLNHGSLFKQLSVNAANRARPCCVCCVCCLKDHPFEIWDSCGFSFTGRRSVFCGFASVCKYSIFSFYCARFLICYPSVYKSWYGGCVPVAPSASTWWETPGMARLGRRRFALDSRVTTLHPDRMD